MHGPAPERLTIASLIAVYQLNQTLTLTAKRFSTDHEWVSFDSATNVGTVGITDYAQKALGDVVFVELPSVDSEVPHGGE